eukprot:PhM_4_TR7996/c0_g1_i1/m.64204/K00147/proA; glutamate-5-semialdehyde dehydrogenase
MQTSKLTSLTPGQVIVLPGDEFVTVDEKLATAFKSGDRLVPVQLAPGSAQLLHIPQNVSDCVTSAVSKATDAWQSLKLASDDDVTKFYDLAAKRLADDAIWAKVKTVNDQDVEIALKANRSTTRLQVSDSMRDLMIQGLQGWMTLPPSRGKVIDTVDHGEWKAELVAVDLGVVSFVFEGRPNVVVDATGVLRGGNTVVFRIGRDALGTARCIMENVIAPSLKEAGLPEGCVSLIEDPSHASAWALFRDNRVALAVARGSGASVALLGNLARGVGVPVSLHGTGGAWMVHTDNAPVDGTVTAATSGSLDRKVCNTLNTICVVRSANTATVLEHIGTGLRDAAVHRKANARVHVVGSDEEFSLISNALKAQLGDAAGAITHDGVAALGNEWEWENDPEVTIHLVDSTTSALELFNKHSPRFVLSIISTSEADHTKAFRLADSPFVCRGMTRWVDGQYALKRPELGLTNWESGRLFGRGGILTGDGVFSVKTRVSGKLLSK